MKKVASIIAALSLSMLVLSGFAVTSATADEVGSAGVTASANEGAKAEAGKKIVGELTAVDPDAKTLSVKADDKVQSFTLAPAATASEDGKPIQFSDLKVGEKVAVSFTVSGFTMTATHVEVLS